MMIDRDGNRTAKLVTTFIFAIILTIMVKANFGYLTFLDSLGVTEIQKSPSPFWEHFYSGVTFLFSPSLDIIWMLVIAFFLWGFRYRIPAIWALATLAGADVVGFLVKSIVQRPRPELHLAADDGYSYPSGHTLGAFIVLAVIWITVVPLLKKRSLQVITKIVLVVVMILVMISRVYLNAHYPSDTIGAVLIGYTWLLFAENLYPVIAPKIAKWPLLKKSIY